MELPQSPAGEVKPVLKATDWNQPATTAHPAAEADDLSPRTTRDGWEVNVQHCEEPSDASLPASPSSGAADSALPATTTTGPPRPVLAAVPLELLELVRQVVREERRCSLPARTKLFVETEDMGLSAVSQNPEASGTPPGAMSADNQVAAAAPAASHTIHGSPAAWQDDELPPPPPSSTRTVRFSEPAHGYRRERRETRRHRNSTSPAVERSAIDQAWGELFDNQGYPTARLEQILRGLANYIVSH